MRQNSQEVDYDFICDKINKWTNELVGEENNLMTQSQDLEVSGQTVRKHNAKLVAMRKIVSDVLEQQMKLKSDLDFVTEQEAELSKELAVWEKDSRFKSLNQCPDQKKELYELSTNVDNAMKRHMEDIKELVERVNESKKNVMMDDPIQQVGKVLNSHTEALNKIITQLNINENHYEKFEKLLDKITLDTD